jgi:hypothetical protein
MVKLCARTVRPRLKAPTTLVPGAAGVPSRCVPDRTGPEKVEFDMQISCVSPRAVYTESAKPVCAGGNLGVVIMRPTAPGGKWGFWLYGELQLLGFYRLCFDTENAIV